MECTFLHSSSFYASELDIGMVLNGMYGEEESRRNQLTQTHLEGWSLTDMCMCMRVL